MILLETGDLAGLAKMPSFHRDCLCTWRSSHRYFSARLMVTVEKNTIEKCVQTYSTIFKACQFVSLIRVSTRTNVSFTNDFENIQNAF